MLGSKNSITVGVTNPELGLGSADSILRLQGNLGASHSDRLASFVETYEDQMLLDAYFLLDTLHPVLLETAMCSVEGCQLLATWVLSVGCSGYHARSPRRSCHRLKEHVLSYAYSCVDVDIKGPDVLQVLAPKPTPFLVRPDVWSHAHTSIPEAASTYIHPSKAASAPAVPAFIEICRPRPLIVPHSCVSLNGTKGI